VAEGAARLVNIDMSAERDRFSRQAARYARFRPSYPIALYEQLVKLVPAREHAWDCATGSGQAARELSRYFTRVTATDVSAAQLKHASAPANVSFKVAAAESPNLFEPASLDLVTVAQAAHWFNPETFYPQVRAALKPGGIIAIWGYGWFRISPEIDAILHPYGSDFLAPFWSERNRIVLEGYRNFPFPFERIPVANMQMRCRWSLPRIKGYLDSWSATQSYRDQTGQDPFDTIHDALSAAWRKPGQRRSVVWDLTILVGRN
jgi:SAM-dependent methyltransferase